MIKAKLVPYISGSPGIGKSEMVRAIAKQLNLFVIDVRLSSCDPTDMSGFPVVSGKKGTYLPMEMFPVEGDKIPEGYDGWFLFLDELPLAPQSVQKAAYKVILDRYVGNHKLHKRVLCIAAGNLDTDNAMVEPMSTALQSRLVHLELKVGLDEWIDWASTNKVHHKIIAFVRYNPTALADFDPHHSDKTFSCPRTLYFLSKLLKQWDDITEDKLPAIVGSVGCGIGLEFFTYCKVYKYMPTPEQLLNDPDGVHIPAEPDRRFALTGMIANYVDEDNAEALLSIVDRLPMEFQVITIQQALAKSPLLMQTTAFRKRSSVITRASTI